MEEERSRPCNDLPGSTHKRRQIKLFLKIHSYHKYDLTSNCFGKARRVWPDYQIDFPLLINTKGQSTFSHLQEDLALYSRHHLPCYCIVGKFVRVAHSQDWNKSPKIAFEQLPHPSRLVWSKRFKNYKFSDALL